ncbi:Nif3-like dinuclear metal center hexameric protein [soil metagenome]
MPRLNEIVATLDRLAPPRFALGFDKVGLQISPESREIDRVIVALDRSLAAIERAVASGAGLLITHHPLLFRPVERIGDDYEGRAIRRLIRHGIGFFAAHTNWDAARGGINDALAARLNLTGISPFGMAMDVDRLKLVVFTPDESVEAILDAASTAGAGVVGDYRRCAFVSEGEGRFDAPSPSKPAVGEPGKRNLERESRIEMVFPSNLQQSVEKAVRAAHPYEEPALDFVKLVPYAEQPLGRLGDLLTPQTLREWVASVDEALDTRSLAWGDPDSVIERIAVEGGAADGDWRAARRAGAQVLVTGEVKQHIALEAAESGFALIQAGHYATEQPGVAVLAKALSEGLPSLEVEIFAPAKGTSGRPFWNANGN